MVKVDRHMGWLVVVNHVMQNAIIERLAASRADLGVLRCFSAFNGFFVAHARRVRPLHSHRCPLNLYTP
jgi:hypothetical protein